MDYKGWVQQWTGLTKGDFVTNMGPFQREASRFEPLGGGVSTLYKEMHRHQVFLGSMCTSDEHVA